MAFRPRYSRPEGNDACCHKPDEDDHELQRPQHPHVGKKEPTPQSCPLDFYVHHASYMYPPPMPCYN